MENLEKLSDLFLVAFLCTKNHEIKATTRTEKNRIEFNFENTPELKKDITTFIENDETVIRIRSLAKKYKDLSFFVHSPDLLQLQIGQERNPR